MFTYGSAKAAKAQITTQQMVIQFPVYIKKEHHGQSSLEPIKC